MQNAKDVAIAEEQADQFREAHRALPETVRIYEKSAA